MIDTQDHLGPCCDGTGRKASQPRKKIDNFHLFVLLLRSPTQVAPKCVSHQWPTTAHLSRGTLTCAHSGSTPEIARQHLCSTCEGTGGASVGGTANGSSRCFSTPLGDAVGVCRHVVWGAGWARQNCGRPCLPHTSRTKLASAFACASEGKSANDRRGTPVATIATRPAVSSAESRSRCILGAWPP